MKKCCRLFLSILISSLLLVFSAIPSFAITTDSLFEMVESACNLIYDTRLEYKETENQSLVTSDKRFPVATIAVYTFHNIDSKHIEGFGDKVFYGSYSTYKIAADVFEKRASQLFSNVNVNQLRKDSRYFDVKKNAYVFDVSNYAEGWGAIDDCALVGYKEKNGIYTFYGYLGSYWIPDEYLEDVKSLKNFNDTIKINDFDGVRIDTIRHKEEKYFNISERFKTTLSCKNDTIKFLSWEIVDSLPNADDLITIHSVSNNSSDTSSSANSSMVQSKTSSSAQTTVVNSSNAAQSKSNSSSQTNTSTISSVAQSQSSSSNQTTVSNSSNATQSKPNSSSQTNTSSVVQSQSSSSGQLEGSITSNSAESDISDTKETTIEKVDNKNKHNINKFWIVMSGVTLLLAIGAVAAIILIKRKRRI